MTTKYEIADLLLHSPEFQPEKLVSFHDLLRSHILEHIEKAIALAPETIKDIKAVIAISNADVIGSYDSCEGKVILIGEITDEQAITLLEGKKEHIDDEFGNNTLDNVNDTRWSDDENEALEEADNSISAGCILHLKKNPGTRIFKIVCRGDY